MVQLSPAQAFSDTFELADVFVVYKQETKKGGKFQMSEFNLFKDRYNKFMVKIIIFCNENSFVHWFKKIMN